MCAHSVGSVSLGKPNTLTHSEMCSETPDLNQLSQGVGGGVEVGFCIEERGLRDLSTICKAKM